MLRKLLIQDIISILGKILTAKNLMRKIVHAKFCNFDFRVNFTGLPSIGWMSPNPKVYMEIRRANESGNFDVIHRTAQQVTRSPSYLGKFLYRLRFEYTF